MTERVEATPLSTVQKLKLQLFHRLQRRHRDAWKRYWGAFQLYLAAKLSLEEFHALAEELLGPDKHLHNQFVVALLSTAYQEVDDCAELHTSPPAAPERQDHNGEGGGEAVRAAAGPSSCSAKDPLLQIIKEEGVRHDLEQRSSVLHGSRELHGRKRPHSSVASADNNAEETVNKLKYLDRERAHSDHPDHHSAQLLMGLGKHATTISPSPITITPGSTVGRQARLDTTVDEQCRRPF